MRSETTKLTMADLMTLEEYAAQRKEFRTQVLEYKRSRQLALGPNLMLAFENRHTIRYQVQEMLRLERIVDPATIRAELAAYNRLIPDGANWKATCFIEFADAAARHGALARLRGIERTIWVQVAELPRISAIAEEDPDRSSEDETSAVHFLRFELDALQAAVVKAGARLRFGVEHAEYAHDVTAPDDVRQALVEDLA